jgi:predicted amidohydrolase YtcJ
MNARQLMSLLTVLMCSMSGCVSADLVLRNGKIATVDDRYGEVEAIAVRGDRILAVGTNAEIGRYVDSQTRVIDLAGRRAIPGFIEGHGHFTSLGSSMLNLDLRNVQNWDEVIALVKEAVDQALPGEWILGRGWHQEKWDKSPPGAVEGFPTHAMLSAISPNNPVCLTHASGHACFFNAKAMALAGVDENTKDPQGGEILHDNAGQPIGVFRETAANLVQRVYAAQTAKDVKSRRAHLRRIVELADKECLSKGVTSFQDAGSSLATIDGLKELVEEGAIGTRLWVMIRDSNEALTANLNRYKMIGVGNNHLTVRAIKRSIDGALGSRGAWLLKPYTDLPSSSGLNTATVESVTETARLAINHDFQLCVHAIGDRANREVLDIYQQNFASNPTRRDLRWRIEHAQHVHRDDIPRFAQLGVIASMQGVHCTSDAPYVEDRLGRQRAEEGAYVWKKFMESGAVVTNGTDTPVEDVSPIASYCASVSRRSKDGSVFYPNQRMSRLEALKSYTINCAYSAFEEKDKGSLTPGKLADIVILSNDILTCPEAQISDTTIDYTIVGGKILYQSP